MVLLGAVKIYAIIRTNYLNAECTDVWLNKKQTHREIKIRRL